MKKLILLKLCLLCIIFSSTALSQRTRIENTTSKKQNTETKKAIAYPQIKNFDGTFRFKIKSGISFNEAVSETEVVTKNNPSDYYFSNEILTLIKSERDHTNTTTKVINDYLEVEILSKEAIESNRKFKTPFISK